MHKRQIISFKIASLVTDKRSRFFRIGSDIADLISQFIRHEYVGIREVTDVVDITCVVGEVLVKKSNGVTYNLSDMVGDKIVPISLAWRTAIIRVQKQRAHIEETIKSHPYSQQLFDLLDEVKIGTREYQCMLADFLFDLGICIRDKYVLYKADNNLLVYEHGRLLKEHFGMGKNINLRIGANGMYDCGISQSSLHLLCVQYKFTESRRVAHYEQAFPGENYTTVFDYQTEQPFFIINPKGSNVRRMVDSRGRPVASFTLPPVDYNYYMMASGHLLIVTEDDKKKHRYYVTV